MEAYFLDLSCDFGQSEDSFFGTRLRQELLRGLLFGAAALTVLVLVVLTAVVLLTDLPVTVIVLIYLALVIVPRLQRLQQHSQGGLGCLCGDAHSSLKSAFADGGATGLAIPTHCSGPVSRDKPFGAESLGMPASSPMAS